MGVKRLKNGQTPSHNNRGEGVELGAATMRVVQSATVRNGEGVNRTYVCEDGLIISLDFPTREGSLGVGRYEQVDPVDVPGVAAKLVAHALAINAATMLIALSDVS